MSAPKAKSTSKLKNGTPSTAFQQYADASLKAAMQLNLLVNEMRTIEQEDVIKPVGRAKRSMYDDLCRVADAYDSSDWADVLMAGVPKSEAISKVFPS